MIGWLGTTGGRLVQAILGIALLWLGIAQVTAFGLMMMLTGLIVAVAAVVPPRQRVRVRGFTIPQTATK